MLAVPESAVEDFQKYVLARNPSGRKLFQYSLAIILVVFTLVSMWKENRFGWPLRDIIWWLLAIDLKRGAALVIT